MRLLSKLPFTSTWEFRIPTIILIRVPLTRYDAYSSELSEYVAEYESAKQELQKNFIPEYLNGHKFNWNLDFGAKQLTINILCNCDIPELGGEGKNA